MVPNEIVLSTEDLRAATAYAAECAQEVLAVFESAHPADLRRRRLRTCTRWPTPTR